MNHAATGEGWWDWWGQFMQTSFGVQIDCFTRICDKNPHQSQKKHADIFKDLHGLKLITSVEKKVWA